MSLRQASTHQYAWKRFRDVHINPPSPQASDSWADLPKNSRQKSHPDADDLFGDHNIKPKTPRQMMEIPINRVRMHRHRKERQDKWSQMKQSPPAPTKPSIIRIKKQNWTEPSKLQNSRQISISDFKEQQSQNRKQQVNKRQDSHERRLTTVEMGNVTNDLTVPKLRKQFSVQINRKKIRLKRKSVDTRPQGLFSAQSQSMPHTKRASQVKIEPIIPDITAILSQTDLFRPWQNDQAFTFNEGIQNYHSPFEAAGATQMVINQSIQSPLLSPRPFTTNRLRRKRKQVQLSPRKKDNISS